MIFKRTETIICGPETCASLPGEFCHYLGSKKFGQRPYCCCFSENLDENNGWVIRCAKCKEQFTEDDGY